MIDAIVKIAGSLLVGGLGLFVAGFAVIFLFIMCEEIYRQYGGKK
jgi:hypothetical protein